MSIKGNKAATLEKLQKNGFLIPSFIIVETGLSPEELTEKISSFHESSIFAVRSSAEAEDSSTESFAGYFYSALGVKKQSLYEEYGSNGVVCLGIHEQDVNEDDLKKVIDQHDLTYSIAVDAKSLVTGSKGKTFDAYGMNRRQLYILIDRDGIVQPDLRFEELEKKIRELRKK